MAKKILIGILSLLIIVLIIGAIRFLNQDNYWICVDGDWVSHGNPDSIKPSEDCPGQAQKIEANIVVNSPLAGQKVGKNLVIRGIARVFENQLNWSILEANTKKEIISGTAYANSADAGLFGQFEINAAIPDEAGTNIEAQVFDYSAKDGSKIDVVKIPLNFDRNLKDYYEVYYSNNKLDPEISCIKVFPLIKSSGNEPVTMRGAIESLLGGVGEKDRDSGYYTSIPENSKINYIEKEGITVKVDFGKEIENNLGGSCRVGAIRAQIIKTIYAFDKTVRSVIISVDGNSETALQP